MEILIWLPLLMYVSGLFMILFKCKHLLLMLMSLEFIVLSLYLGLFVVYSYFSLEFYFSVVFLTFSVCEGALGLSLLVSMIRSFGNDYFHSLSILW